MTQVCTERQEQALANGISIHSVSVGDKLTGAIVHRQSGILDVVEQ